jgi:hypothetical protein
MRSLKEPENPSMRTEIAEFMIDIEAQLRQLGLWERIQPSTAVRATGNG